MLTQSPLSSISNNIIKTGKRSDSSLAKVSNEYKSFTSFLDTNAIQVGKASPINDKKINQLLNINVLSTFGTIGGLLNSFVTNKLDLRGVISGIFSGKGSKLGRPSRDDTRTVKPSVSENKLKLTGTRALNVTNVIFSGLKASSGLGPGEDIGKEVSAFSGSLAGSLLSGAIGKSLIPVNGVGFVLAGSVGLVSMGLMSSSGYNPLSSAKEFQERKLAEKPKGIEKRQFDITDKFKSVLESFENPVNKFKTFVTDILTGRIFFGGATEEEEAYPSNPPPGSGDIQGEGGTFFPLPGGDVGSKGIVSSGQKFGAPREGGKRPHQGLDMTHHNGSLNAPVVAYKSGRVIEASYSGYGPGGAVKIDHGGGLITHYYHITPSVKVGDNVYGGEKIANLYPDGNNTHLHFEIRPSGKPVDPEPILRSMTNRISKPLSREEAQRIHMSQSSSMATGYIPDGNNPLGIEIHADPNAKGQKTGVINYYGENSPIIAALRSQYGSYSPNFRREKGPGSGLGFAERKGTILETSMQISAEENARRIAQALMKDPNRKVNIFTGHADVPKGKGETGAEGEVEHNKRVVEELKKEVRRLGLTNVNFITPEVVADPKSPKSNWSKQERAMQEGLNRNLRTSSNIVSQQPQILPIPVPQRGKPQLQPRPAAPSPAIQGNLNINPNQLFVQLQELRTSMFG